MTELFALANALTDSLNAFNGRGYVRSKDGEYVTHILVPGIKAADMDIEYREGGIAIRGATPANDEDPTAFRNSIERYIELPDDANPQKIRATLVDGVLTFRIAVRTPEEQGVHKITIE